MARCNACGRQFRTPPGEEQDHECPRCGWEPWMEDLYEDEDFEDEED